MTDKDTNQEPEASPVAADVKDSDKEHAQSADKQDDANEATEAIKEKSDSSKRFRLKRLLATYWVHKKLAIPVTVAVALLVVLSVPFTRYKVLSLFLKEEVTISLTDSTTNSPVSDALVQFGSFSATTSASGKTSMKLPVGSDTVNVYKKYYKSSTDTLFVSYTRSQDSFQIRLVATGRQVPVVITNMITNKPVANAEIKVMDTEAKTDASGKATIVLPVNLAEQSGTLTASGYNTLTVKVQVTSQAVAANTFALTPAGYIYFLSNLSGKIDVVKTNLDGTNRKTVLAGTGNEIPTDTVLLASRDWKYLALYAKRSSSGNPEIDLIDTSTDTMSNIDEGNATFNLVGWDGDRFIYQVNRTGILAWQNGQGALKSFNAPAKTITVLAQTSAEGNGPDNYADQRFGNTYILNDKVIYSLDWSQPHSSYYYIYYGTPAPLNGKQATLNSVNSDGSNNTIVKGFSVAPSNNDTNLAIDTTPYDGPNSIAVRFYNSTSNTNTYYEYQNGQVTASSDITDQNYYNRNTIPTYLESPSGNQTFWSVPADGKNTLNVGDRDGNNANKVAILSDYNPYGWYTDNYLLVSKNGSELYIMPVSGGTPLRITDYYKPSQYYRGYGGGYGGL